MLTSVKSIDCRSERFLFSSDSQDSPLDYPVLKVVKFRSIFLRGPIWYQWAFYGELRFIPSYR